MRDKNKTLPEEQRLAMGSVLDQYCHFCTVENKDMKINDDRTGGLVESEMMCDRRTCFLVDRE